MRHLLCFFFLFQFSFSGAQFLKGNKSISGQVFYDSSYDSNDGKKVKKLVLMPSFSYSFSPIWSLVLGVGYKSESINYDDLKECNAYAFVFEPSIKKQWLIDPKFSFFLQLGFPLEMGYKKEEMTSQDVKNDYWSCGVRMRPGVDYLLSKRWKVGTTIGEIGYSYTRNESQDTEISNFKAGVNFSNISFSLKYLLPMTN